MNTQGPPQRGRSFRIWDAYTGFTIFIMTMAIPFNYTALLQHLVRYPSAYPLLVLWQVDALLYGSKKARLCVRACDQPSEGQLQCMNAHNTGTFVLSSIPMYVPVRLQSHCESVSNKDARLCMHNYTLWMFKAKAYNCPQTAVLLSE